jgi:transposase
MATIASERKVSPEELLARVEELEDLLSGRDRTIAELRNVIDNKDAQYAELQKLIFGAKSERVAFVDPRQGELVFNEAERDGCLVPEGEQNVQTIRRRVGKRTGRKRPAPEFERLEVLHDIPDDEKCCPCCGLERKRIGEERSEEIEVIPARIVVHIHVRPKYGPCPCDDFELSGAKPIAIAPGPAKIASGSLFSNHTAAFLLVSKFADGLPFYRQEKVFERMGLSVSRGTMAHLAIRIGSALGPVIDLMRRDIRGSPVLRMDETFVQVLKEPGKAPTSESRMWVAMGYRDGRPILFFIYNDSRSGKVAEAIVGSGFAGFLQTDGYGGYTAIGKRPGIIHVGCWAHIRREFYKLYESDEKTPLVAAILALIRELYTIERRLRDALEKGTLSVDDFMTERKVKTSIVLAKILAWLHEQDGSVPPQSALGKAISYALGQYNRAIRYIEHPLLTPDNNLIENAIRPFVIGRKNWLFCDNPAGAWASSTLYTIIETAKANGHEPYRYLCYLFDHLPLATTPDTVEALLPYNLKPTEYCAAVYMG